VTFLVLIFVSVLKKNKDQVKLAQARQALLRAPTKIPPFRQYSGIYEKVCLSAFNRGYCRCGQPLVSELHKQANQKRRRNSNDQTDESPSAANKKVKVTNEKN
jgi:hypothetical protein